jgi:HAD superfamily hydrolase (TIGR01509 family)
LTDKAAQAYLPLTAVIFDCDGILVDTEPLHYKAFQKVLVPLGLGHSFERYLEEFIGFDDRDAFLHAFNEAGREIDADALAGLIEAKGKALQELAEQGVPTFPGVVDLVRELKAGGIPLAVASGALRHEVEAFIRSLGLAGAFCTIVAADDVKKSKPDPETYCAALERLKETLGWTSIDPARCIAIEDTPAGILSAKAAGLFAIAVTNSFPQDQLAGADHVIDSLSILHLPGMVSLIGLNSGADS